MLSGKNMSSKDGKYFNLFLENDDLIGQTLNKLYLWGGFPKEIVPLSDQYCHIFFNVAWSGPKKVGFDLK